MELPSKIVLFDGVCNVCDRSVQFIIKHDKKGQFYFASLQSEIGKELLEKFKIDRSKTDSVILIENDTAFIKSKAALRIARHLNGAWKLFSVFSIFPSFFTNIFYDFFAAHRYKWFGKKDQCMIPSSEIRSRFLDS